MKMRRRDVLNVGLAAVSAAALGAIGCKRDGAREVVAYTSIDQVFAEPIFRAFEASTGVKVRAVFDTEETKSTGVLNRIIAEARSPQCDVFWSGDPVRPFVLMKRGLVEPYLSPVARGLPTAFRAADGTWAGIAARARVLLVNKDKAGGGDRPRSVRDLAAPTWKGRGAMANPLYGTTTMHAAALAAAWGDDKLKAFLDDVKKNETRLASSNGEVKRLVVAGEVAFGIVDTDDANEAVKDGAPVDVVYPDQDELGTLVIPSSVLRLRGPSPEPAKKLIDALLGADTERRMAEAGGYMPLRAGVPVAPGARRIDDLR